MSWPWLKRLLGSKEQATSPAAAPSKPEIQFRVIPFAPEMSDKYVIEYSTNGRWWTRIVRAFVSTDKLDLCSNTQPVLMDFPEAVEFAKSMTKEKLAEWNARQKIIYDEHISRINERIHARQLTSWYSHPQKQNP